MNNGFYYQLLAGLSRESNRFNYPRYLKDLVRTGEIDETKNLEEVLSSEIVDADITGPEGAEYMLHIADNALLFAIYRENFTAFNELADVIEKRLHMLKGAGGSYPNVDNWMWYVGYLRVCVNRLIRSINIEQFEFEIDDIEWSELGDRFIYAVSGITGFVYLNEENTDKFKKSRFWLQQAVSSSEMSKSLGFFLNLADFFLTSKSPEMVKQIEKHIKTLENTANTTHDPNLGRIYRAAVLDLQARAMVFQQSDADDDHIQIEESLRAVRQVEKNIDYEGKSSPAFVRAFLKKSFSNYYLGLTKADLDREDIEDLQAMALDGINEALSISRRMGDHSLRDYLQIEWLSVVGQKTSKVSEKDFKDVVSAVRKTNNLPAMVRASKYYAEYFLGQGNSQKAFEILYDLLKRGFKRIDEGGFYMVTHAMREINKVLNHRVNEPGVSWVTFELEGYFDTITEIIGVLEEKIETVGFTLFQDFRNYFIDLEAASHFNIKVYLRYQYQSLILLGLSAGVSEDEGASRIANQLISKIGDKNNPLSFIQANWDEFKLVPNSVRNKVLNKCISISKGDLPLAAELLDFSYRNLRSYITFKEVNRLGFFLDEKDTKSRQLEQGIRLMFFDLYKKGTIFEVVFDMPRFLVDHIKGGFSSQDLEEALDIKGTTAKKYIKIMMQIGLIKLERSVGRKHFYKLRKDNIMTRLGQEQRVLTAEA